jgi:hypothetical protein
MSKVNQLVIPIILYSLNIHVYFFASTSPL